MKSWRLSIGKVVRLFRIRSLLSSVTKQSAWLAYASSTNFWSSGSAHRGASGKGWYGFNSVMNRRYGYIVMWARRMASVLLGLPALFSRWSVSSLIVDRFAILLDDVEALFADVDKIASISQSGFKSKPLRFRRVANFAGRIGCGVLATGCGAGRARMGHLGRSSDLDRAIL